MFGSGENTWLMAQHLNVHSLSLLSARGVHVDLAGLGVRRTEASDAAHASGAELRALETHGRSHNRTPASNGLEVGHGAAARRGIVSGGASGERAEGGYAAFLQEGTDAL